MKKGGVYPRPKKYPSIAGMNSLDRASFSAGSTTDAKGFIDDMGLFNRSRDRLYRAEPGTFRTPDAFRFVDLVLQSFTGGFCHASLNRRPSSRILNDLFFSLIGRDHEFVRHPNAVYGTNLRALLAKTATIDVKLDLLFFSNESDGVCRTDLDAKFTTDALGLVIGNSPPEPLRGFYRGLQVYFPFRSGLEGPGETVGHMGHRKRVREDLLSPLPKNLERHPIKHAIPSLHQRVQGKKDHSR